jgi:hypothetical protein
VVIVGDCDFGAVGEVPTGSGGDEVMTALMPKIGWRLPDERRMRMWEMGTEISCHVGEIFGEVRADEFGMNPFKEVIAAPGFRIHHQVKVTGTHAQRFKAVAD